MAKHSLNRTPSRLRRKIVLPLAVTATLALGLGVGAATPSAPGALDTSAPTVSTAWTIFEDGGGARQLKVDPTRPFRVDFRGASEAYPQGAGPEDAVVVGKDGRWYWFAASYTDQP